MRASLCTPSKMSSAVGTVHNHKLMCMSAGKSDNATSVDPLVAAKHETDARYCMYAGPYNRIAYVLYI